MLAWFISVCFVILCLACFYLCKRLQWMSRALADRDRGIFVEIDRLQTSYEAGLRLIDRLNPLAVEMLMRLSDEAERAVGHTRETKWLENLPIDVRDATGGWLTLRDADEIRKAGYELPDARFFDLADVMRLAFDIDRIARNVEPPLQDALRRCQIAHGQTIRWVGDVFALAQRLQHGDAAEARKVLKAAIDIWEASNLPAAVCILEHDREIMMARG
ncbi:hypothetical protein [Paraburkholderia sp. J8-2]|uniref:hypothetical protein n=1 Tax=Paraburkholderia sp. J8-2 TaxID=2805440 RepID=UPI002AB5F7A7|nr:hypothetical protein [Paraburkholderia sp. J8-2]